MGEEKGGSAIQDGVGIYCSNCTINKLAFFSFFKAADFYSRGIALPKMDRFTAT